MLSFIILFNVQLYKRIPILRLSSLQTEQVFVDNSLQKLRKRRSKLLQGTQFPFLLESKLSEFVLHFGFIQQLKMSQIKQDQNGKHFF